MNSKISLKAIVESRSEVGDLLVRPGDSVLIQRGQPRWLILKCPCGCGDEIPVNLDPRAGKAWRIYFDKYRGLTVFPSVWRDSGCQSHFIIWRDQIVLFSGESAWESPSNSEFLGLVERIKRAWPQTGWVSYVQVADLLQEIPWDVLDAARHLVRAGQLQEGRGAERQHFRRR